MKQSDIDLIGNRECKKSDREMINNWRTLIPMLRKVDLLLGKDQEMIVETKVEVSIQDNMVENNDQVAIATNIDRWIEADHP